MALKAIENARQAAAQGATTDAAAHVGYHLIDRGRDGLEADVAYRPTPSIRARRALLRHAAPLYLGAIAIFTCLLVAGAVAYARHEGASLTALAAVLMIGRHSGERAGHRLRPAHGR